MPEGKAKFIEDAARVIDGRVEALRSEYDRIEQSDHGKACDLSAIMEAEHCARLIRSLKIHPYRGDPYAVAHDHWNHGRANERAPEREPS